jgi:hypothetical protein
MIKQADDNRLSHGGCSGTRPLNPLGLVDAGLVDHGLERFDRIRFAGEVHLHRPFQRAVLFELGPALVRTFIRFVIFKAMLLQKLRYVAVAPVV